MSVVDVVLDVPNVSLPSGNYVSDASAGSSAYGKRVFRKHDSHGDISAFKGVKTSRRLES